MEVKATDSNKGRSLSMGQVIRIFVFPVIIVGNSLILLAIKRHKSLKKVTYYLLGNLAVADLVFGFNLGLRGMFSILKLNSPLFCAITTQVSILALGSSLTGLVLICTQTFLSARFLFVGRNLFSNKIGMFLVAGSWLSWSAFLLWGILTADIKGMRFNGNCSIYNGFATETFLTFISVICAVHIVLIIWLQLHTLFLIRRQRNSLQRNLVSHVNPDAATMTKINKVNRAARITQIVTIVLLVTLFSWGPSSIGLLLFFACGETCGVTDRIIERLLICTAFQSVSNVFVYSLKSPEFREAFAHILRCRRAVIEPDTS